MDQASGVEPLSEKGRREPENYGNKLALAKKSRSLSADIDSVLLVTRINVGECALLEDHIDAMYKIIDRWRK